MYVYYDLYLQLTWTNCDHFRKPRLLSMKTARRILSLILLFAFNTRISVLPLIYLILITVSRLIVKEGEVVLVDSGDVYDTTITGGRLGLFVYGQQNVIWSRLQANCQDRFCSHTVFSAIFFFGSFFCSFFRISNLTGFLLMGFEHRRLKRTDLFQICDLCKCSRLS